MGLQSCQHSFIGSELKDSKKDLNKAALLNVQLGLAYLKQGDRPRAKKKLLTALEEAPLSADTNSAMAYFFEQTHELKRSKAFYLKAIALASGSGAQLNNYGTFLCRQGAYQEAELYFLKAVNDSHYINTAAAYENAGLCSLAEGSAKKARLYFKNALNQDPSRKTAFYELVKLEQKAGHDKTALLTLQKYPDLVLHDKIILNLAKQIASKAGQYELAAKYEHSLASMESHTNNIGVNNEYNNNN